MSSNEGRPDGVIFENRLSQSREPAHNIQQRLLTLSEILGRKWLPVILYYLFREESMGFAELRGEIDDISAKVLSENLSKLTDWGFIHRKVVCENPYRVKYTVTQQGQSLKPVLIAALNSGLEISHGSEIGDPPEK